MNRPLRLIALTLTVACFSQAAEFAPYDTTLAAAKEAGADFVVFY